MAHPEGRAVNRFERRPTATLLAVFVFGFILTLGLLEGTARLLFHDVNFVGESGALWAPKQFGNTRGYWPNARGVSWGAEVVTDAFGFRFDPTLGRREGKPAVVFIGDSVTFGVGVDARETLVGRVARQLGGYRILNASATGYGAQDYLNVARNFVVPKRLSLDCRRVVVVVTLNDILESKTLEPRQETALPDEHYSGVAAWAWRFNRGLGLNEYLIGRSKLYLLAKRAAFDGSRAWFAADAAPYADPAKVAALSRRLEELRSLLVEAGVAVDLILLPYEYQLRTGSLESREPQRRLALALERRGVPILDLFEPIRARMAARSLSSRTLYLFNDHCHLSRVGHEIVAEAILRILASSGESATAR